MAGPNFGPLVQTKPGRCESALSLSKRGGLGPDQAFFVFKVVRTFGPSGGKLTHHQTMEEGKRSRRETKISPGTTWGQEETKY